MSHRIKCLHTDYEPITHIARCSCGWHSARYPTAQAVEDEMFKHRLDIEALRAKISGRHPTLKAERDWAEMQADNEENSAPDRTLWRQMADEMSHRLNDKTPPPPQQELELPW